MGDLIGSGFGILNGTIYVFIFGRSLHACFRQLIVEEHILHTFNSWILHMFNSSMKFVRIARDPNGWSLDLTAKAVDKCQSEFNSYGDIKTYVSTVQEILY